MADAFDHSLDKPETLGQLCANLGRIRLVSSAAVLAAAEECCDRVVDLYAKPNRTIDQLFTTLVAPSFADTPLIEELLVRAPSNGRERSSLFGGRNNSVLCPMAS